jgi:hypothetical protein
MVTIEVWLSSLQYGKINYVPQPSEGDNVSQSLKSYTGRNNLKSGSAIFLSRRAIVYLAFTRTGTQA